MAHDGAPPDRGSEELSLIEIMIYKTTSDKLRCLSEVDICSIYNNLRFAPLASMAHLQWRNGACAIRNAYRKVVMAHCAIEGTRTPSNGAGAPTTVPLSRRRDGAMAHHAAPRADDPPDRRPAPPAAPPERPRARGP